jgi:DNA-directed RNA polymerase specialized sigma24 family protein
LEESSILRPAEDEKILQVHEALDVLASEDALKAQIVKLRFFAGLSHDEIAALLDINEKKVRRQTDSPRVKRAR